MVLAEKPPKRSQNKDTIIIHGCNKQKLQAVYDEIKTETSNKNIDMFTADFLSFAEVKRFAQAIKQKYEHLEMLINNAGTQFIDKREISVDLNDDTSAISIKIERITNRSKT